MGGVMSGQLSLFDDRTGRDCPFWGGLIPVLDGTATHDICTSGGTPTATICSRGVFGEPPRCAYREPDNSAAACSRRLEWLREHDSD